MKTIDYNEVLDFGDGPVTDVDTKLEILKFSYNWSDAVEEEERRMEEEQKQQKEMKKKMEKEISGEGKKDCNKNHKSMNTMDYNEILDFGENPVTDVDSKIEILKFSYNWSDAVEEEERRMEEEHKQQKEMEKKLKKEIAGEEKKDCNTNHKRITIMDYNEVLDFGENPVTDVDTKLQILKFSYNWSDAVEEEERRMEQGQNQQNGMKKVEKEHGGEEKRNSYKNHNRKQPEKMNRKQHKVRKHAEVHIIKQQKLRLETAESTKEMIKTDTKKASGDKLASN